MTKSGNRSLIIIIIILLITNVAMLFAWWKANHKITGEPHKSRLAEFVKNDLGFSAGQMASFDSIKAAHRQEAKGIFDELRKEKTDVYQSIGVRGFADSSLDAAAGFSAQKQEELEKLMLVHLKEIRALCTAEQLPKFDSGFYKVMMRGGKGPDK